MTKLLQYALIFPIILGVIPFIYSYVTIFSYPSYDGTTKGYLLEVSFTDIKYENIHWGSSGHPVNQTNIKLDPIYRFGLWGYCSGTNLIDLDSETQDTFSKSKCSNTQMKYQFNLSEILNSGLVLEDGEYTIYNDSAPYAIVHTDYASCFNELLAGCILSGVLLISTVILCASSFLAADGYLRLILSGGLITIGIGIIQWAVMSYGVMHTESSYNELASLINSRSEVLGITAKTGELLRFGWTSAILALLCTALLIIGVGLEFVVIQKLDDDLAGDIPGKSVDGTLV